jgi:catechol 2,3-dioxygenase-like lactoylglutathione lyase family enzyme
MLDHISIQCADVDAGAAFYDAVLAPFGGSRLFDTGNAFGYGAQCPTFWIGRRQTGG